MRTWGRYRTADYSEINMLEEQKLTELLDRVVEISENTQKAFVRHLGNDDANFMEIRKHLQAISQTTATQAKDLSYMKERLDHLDKKISEKYVTRDQFEPIKRFVYGLITFCLLAIAGAVTALIL